MEGSEYFRLFRVEFLLNYKQKLNPDTFKLTVSNLHQKDDEFQIIDAHNYLLSVVIPSFLNLLPSLFLSYSCFFPSSPSSSASPSPSPSPFPLFLAQVGPFPFSLLYSPPRIAFPIFTSLPFLFPFPSSFPFSLSFSIALLLFPLPPSSPLLPIRINTARKKGALSFSFQFLCSHLPLFLPLHMSQEA